MNLGQKLKQLRQSNKLSMEQLADKLNEAYPNEDGSKSFGKSKISKWESGKVDPAVSSMAKVAKFFGVTLDYLLGLDELNFTQPVVEIPIVSNVLKKEDIYNKENIIGHYYLPRKNEISKHNLVCVDITENKNNKNKSIALIDLDENVTEKDLGLFLTKDSDIPLIREKQTVNDYVMLIPQNVDKEFKPNLYNEDEIVSLGKVVLQVGYHSDGVNFN